MDIHLLTTRDYELDFLPMPCAMERCLPSHTTAGNSVQKGLVYLRTLAMIRQKIRSLHPDIVHLHVIKLPWLEQRLIKFIQRNGAKCVMTMHDIFPHESDGPSPALRHCYDLLDGVALHAPENAERFNQLCRPSARVQQALIPHGDYEFLAHPIPTEQARAALNISPTKKVLLFFGYIRKYKGLDILLQALEQLVKTESDILLLVAGKPHGELTEYTDRIAAAGLAPNVRFISEYIPMAHTGRYFSAADIVVLPYRKVDQSGVVPLAAAYRKPVVVTHVGGLSTQVNDGTTGRIVPPENPEKLAAAIRDMLTGGELAAMGEALYQSMHRHSSWAIVAQQYQQFYQSVIQ